MKELWPTCLDLCCAVEMCESRDKEREQAETAVGETAPVADSTDGTDAHARRGGKRARDETEEIAHVCEESGDEEVIAKYARLRDAVRIMGLEMAWRIPPLVGVSAVDYLDDVICAVSHTRVLIPPHPMGNRNEKELLF